MRKFKSKAAGFLNGLFGGGGGGQGAVDQEGVDLAAILVAIPVVTLVAILLEVGEAPP